MPSRLQEGKLERFPGFPMLILSFQSQALLFRRGGDSGAPGCGCFLALALLAVGFVLIAKARKDLREARAKAPRPADPAVQEGVAFVSPFSRCAACGAGGDKMKATWDGLRKVAWSCTYCGAPAGVQELADEELPPGARQRLGLGGGMGGSMGPGMDPGGAVGGLVTGMLLGSMLSGGHHPASGDWGDGGSSGDWDGGSQDGGWDGGDSGGDSGGGWDSGGDL
jgi:hypothetical protein